MLSGSFVDTSVLCMFYDTEVSNHSALLTRFPGV